jgi:predicted dehydrogenase
LRLVLIGAGMHWHTYAHALKTVPGLTLVGVAPGAPDETLGAFDHAPGLTVGTRRYGDVREMLDREKPDVAQVCSRPDRLAAQTRLCLERGIPTMSEKPLAMTLAELEELYRAAKATGTPLAPMHTMRGDHLLAALARAVREDKIGRPQMVFSQKSYIWGTNRPHYFKSKETFPGLSPFIGIHAFDWLHWMLGDAFTEVDGFEGASHPGYPACPANGSYALQMRNGGTAAVTLDYLRPMKAPSHGDERVRIAGTRGVVEAALATKETSLVTADSPPRQLTLQPQPDIFTTFVRSLRREGPPLMSLADAFRITEISLKARQAAESGKRVSLAETIYK